MKPHGMLFKAEMILALLNTKADVWPAEAIDATKPHKCQTRRGIKLPNWASDGRVEAIEGKAMALANETQAFAEIKCPHPVGQIIYAQETWGWNYGQMGVLSKDCCLTYRVDSFQQPFDGREWVNNRGTFPTGEGKWKPSIFMEPWMSRVWLVVKRVRVERVNQISEADAIAEGISWPDRDGMTYRSPIDTSGMSSLRLAGERYKELFDSINGKGSFDRGDWCWAYDLARISKPDGTR